MIETMFSDILRMSACSAVLILVVMLIRQVLKKTPKRYSYALWLLVLLRLLCPVFPEWNLSLMPQEITAGSAFADLDLGQTPVYTLAADPVETTTAQDGQNAPLNPPVQSGETEVVTVSELLCGIWLTGAAVMLVYGTVSLVLLKHRLRAAVPLREQIFLADAIETPFVLGLVRPKIYLPSAVPGDRMEHIICHERCHIRRLDPVVKLLFYIALCMHWFDPLVWLAFVLMGSDMEMSCDEAVMRNMDIGARADYAESLLCLSTGRKKIAPTPLAFGEGNPKSRIKNILNHQKPRVWVTVLALIAVLACAVFFLTDPLAPRSNASGRIAYTCGERIGTGAFGDAVQEQIRYRQIVFDGSSVFVSTDQDELFYSYDGTNAKSVFFDDWDDAAAWIQQSAVFLKDMPDPVPTGSRKTPVEARLYYNDPALSSEKDAACILYFFDGVPTWFAAGFNDNLYELVECADSHAFDATNSPWQWTRNLTLQDVTFCQVTYFAEDGGAPLREDLNTGEIEELAAILNAVSESEVQFGRSCDPVLNVMVYCSGREYLLRYGEGVVSLTLDTGSAALYPDRQWYIINPDLNAWMEIRIEQFITT